MVGSSIRTEVFVKDVLTRHSNLGEKLDRVGDEAAGPADVDLAGLVFDEPLKVGGVVLCRVVLREMLVTVRVRELIDLIIGIHPVDGDPALRQDGLNFPPEGMTAGVRGSVDEGGLQLRPGGDLHHGEEGGDAHPGPQEDTGGPGLEDEVSAGHSHLDGVSRLDGVVEVGGDQPALLPLDGDPVSVRAGSV